MLQQDRGSRGGQVGPGGAFMLTLRSLVTLVPRDRINSSWSAATFSSDSVVISPNGENSLSLWASTALCWPSGSLGTWQRLCKSSFPSGLLKVSVNPNFAASIPNNPITQDTEYLEERRDPA